MRIERQLAMPEPTRTRRCKYSLGDLNVGDAVVLDPDEVTKWTPASLATIGRNFARNHANSYKFAVRKLDDGSVGIWRVE